MGVGVELGVLGRGGMLVDMKKKRKNRQTYLVRPAHCFPLPFQPPLVPPCVFHCVHRIFDASRPPRFVSCCCCRQSRLAGISGLSQRSWALCGVFLDRHDGLVMVVGEGSGVG